MAVPKRKTSKARRDQRHSTRALEAQSPSFCWEGSCKGTPILPHQVCPLCGFYKGRKVMRTKQDRALHREEVDKVRQARSKKVQPQAPVENDSAES